MDALRNALGTGRNAPGTRQERARNVPVASPKFLPPGTRFRDFFGPRQSAVFAAIFAAFAALVQTFEPSCSRPTGLGPKSALIAKVERCFSGKRGYNCRAVTGNSGTAGKRSGGFGRPLWCRFSPEKARSSGVSWFSAMGARCQPLSGVGGTT